MSNRTPIVAANWKMNITPRQVQPYMEVLKKGLPDQLDREVVLAASPLFLSQMMADSNGSIIEIGAEDCFYKDNGAYTGEVSPMCLSELGIRYVIAGHSERRRYFHETDVTLNKKVHAILRNRMHPIVCCDETLIRSQADHRGEWVVSPVITALKGVSFEQAKEIVMAYEPTWAIGTGDSASAAEAEEGCKLIRDTLAHLYSPELSDRIRVLYGGSVANDNIKSLMAQPDIDGVLVGTASLDPHNFLKLINY